MPNFEQMSSNRSTSLLIAVLVAVPLAVPGFSENRSWVTLPFKSVPTQLLVAWLLAAVSVAECMRHKSMSNGVLNMPQSGCDKVLHISEDSKSPVVRLRMMGWVVTGSHSLLRFWTNSFFWQITVSEPLIFWNGNTPQFSIYQFQQNFVCCEAPQLRLERHCNKIYCIVHYLDTTRNASILIIWTKFLWQSLRMEYALLSCKAVKQSLNIELINKTTGW